MPLRTLHPVLGENTSATLPPMVVVFHEPPMVKTDPSCSIVFALYPRGMFILCAAVQDLVAPEYMLVFDD
jgi:hypothetical protein